MNPACATSRGENRSISRASTSSKASRVGKSPCLTTIVGTPRFAAIARPPAPATLLMTADTGMPASSSAWRLLPRPEIRTTTDMGRDGSCSIDSLHAVTLLLDQVQQSRLANQMRCADRHEDAPRAQLHMQPVRHHDAAVVHEMAHE